MRIGFGTIIGGAVIGIGLMFAGIDSLILYRGWSAYGLDAWDKISYGTAAASVPWVIVGFPFLWWILWLRARWRAVLPLTIAGIVYAVLVAYSLIGAMGSIASVRGQVIAERTSSKEGTDALKEQRDRLKAQYAAIPKARPADTVTAALQAEQTRPLWEATDHCKEVYGASTRKFCAGIAALQGELASARKADDLVGKIEALSGRIDGRAVVGEKADPMAATVSLWLRKFGLDVAEAEASTGLPIATPLVLLIGEMFFVWAGFLLLGIDHKTLVTDALSRAPPVTAAPPVVYRGAVAPSLLPPTPSRFTPAEKHQLTHQRVFLASTDPVTRGRMLAQWFFAECTRPVGAGGLPETDWYRAYRDQCAKSNDVPIGLEEFRELAKKAGAVVSVVDGRFFYSRILPLIPREGAA